MITASIYRTDAKQSAKDGPVAFRDMMFSGNFVNEAGVRAYCETLASENGIINPWIKIATTLDVPPTSSRLSQLIRERQEYNGSDWKPEDGMDNRWAADFPELDIELDKLGWEVI